MKPLLAITIITSLCAASGLAGAGDNPQRTLAPITVQRGQANDCTPPSSDKACATLHAQIRHDFSKREIGMLFGARTSYPESLTSYGRVHARYESFLRDVDMYGAENVALVVR
ncbi:hypothetical protein [Dokdonella soli]|uniref:Uncharacterized protein n=1 Tax=Dokdonella soli TaxID=529810 RepID=A0ABN1IWH1_9GAMM